MNSLRGLGPRILLVIGPGMLVAATGVGAGDLATGSFAGSQLGTAVLWAVLVGGVFKFTLNEGLARWQLATGETFVEGALNHLGRAAGWVFLPYLVLWTYFVGAALMGACGVALHALVPLFDDASTAKVVFGLLASATGLLLVRLGGFAVFERVMGLCIAFMFVTVLVTAGALWPGTSQVLRGLAVPSIPDVDQALSWTVALIGGVGGTVTILCYGYWIREKGRDGREHLTACRLDLGAGYVMTVLFGLGMVIIGSAVPIDGRGADLLVRLGETLNDTLGRAASVVFLVGALAAVFSSLLGVWQAVPYIFADVWLRLRGQEQDDLVETKPYRYFQWALATIPALGLVTSFRQAQLLYAVAGAAFIPLLAFVLLILNGRKSLVGSLANRWPAVAGLTAALGFFAWAAWGAWFG